MLITCFSNSDPNANRQSKRIFITDDNNARMFSALTLETFEMEPSLTICTTLPKLSCPSAQLPDLNQPAGELFVVPESSPGHMRYSCC